MSWLNAATALIKEFEGCKLHAYPDPGTGGAPWTCGFGSTGPDIHQGTVWTQEQAEAALAAHVAQVHTNISSHITAQVNDNQMAAMVCLAYNIGGGNFHSSSLLKDVNAGNFAEAGEQFLVWDRAAGHVMAGLERRRQAERVLFLKPVDGSSVAEAPVDASDNDGVQA